jgi:hypothetical protein
VGVGMFTNSSVGLGLEVAVGEGLDEGIKRGVELAGSPVGVDVLESPLAQPLKKTNPRTKANFFSIPELYTHHLPLAEGCAKLASCLKTRC